MGVTGSGGASDSAEWCVTIHGGAGDLPLEARASHAEGCAAAARVAAEVLAHGGSAIDAVMHAVVVLENDPRFNAGTGACLTDEGTMELDASIMDGALRAGAVCALPPFRNPILIARAVLEDAHHILFAAEGAARFAEEKGFVRAAPDAMITDAVRARFARGAKTPEGFAGSTVGAVARDARGGVAAATSTGGTFFKRVGRVGDTPILGAGTYADDRAGAASATGVGEAIMRVAMTKTITDWLRNGMTPERAASDAVSLTLTKGGAPSGVIVVGAQGSYGWARTTPTMSWATMRPHMSDPARGY